MDSRILTFLTATNICSLTVMKSDGMPHSAAMHFSHSEDPLLMYFSTDSSTEKAQSIKDGAKMKASVVVGFDEETFETFQLRGEIEVVNEPSERTMVQEIHYAKHPGSEKYKEDPTTLMLRFTPSWWRYTGNDVVLES
jgi:general stress protein 26